jgi:hypothetical protein
VTRLLTILAVLVPCAARAAAWTSPEGDLVLTQTTLVDYYSLFARNSTNHALLEEPGGSVVQAGKTWRTGFFLSAEYGLFDRVTLSASAAYFLTRQMTVGANNALFTDAEPNSQHGLQDFSASVKYLAYQHAFRNGGILAAVAPWIQVTVPMSHYDTSVNNPLGDGVLSADFALSLSASFPSLRLFVNADGSYRLREHTAVRVGNVWPADVVAANPSLRVCTPADLAAPVPVGGIPGVGGAIHDQIQGSLEAGYFITDRISFRLLVRRIETLGGEDLTFAAMPNMMVLRNGQKLPMFENSLAYNQAAFFVGGGPYWQITDQFGVGFTYVRAVWFQDFPNIQTWVLSISFNPQLAERRARARQSEEPADQGPSSP